MQCQFTIKALTKATKEQNEKEKKHRNSYNCTTIENRPKYSRFVKVRVILVIGQ